MAWSNRFRVDRLTAGAPPSNRCETIAEPACCAYVTDCRWGWASLSLPLVDSPAWRAGRGRVSRHGGIQTSAASQCSTARPGTRENSRMSSVTSVTPRARAWAGISKSFGPMDLPARSAGCECRRSVRLRAAPATAPFTEQAVVSGDSQPDARRSSRGRSGSRTQPRC
jgi:hypothetical protein